MKPPLQWIFSCDDLKAEDVFKAILLVSWHLLQFALQKPMILTELHRQHLPQSLQVKDYIVR